MKTKKYLGIYLDHSVAHLIEYPSSASDKKIITADTILFGNDPNLKKDESRMQQKEQNNLSDYFKIIAKIILEYDTVLLFGPTDAKVELNKLLRTNHHYDEINIELKTTDQLTDPQMVAFVRFFFNKDHN